MPALPQTMRIAGGRLYVGYPSGFRVSFLFFLIYSRVSKILRRFEPLAAIAFFLIHRFLHTENSELIFATSHSPFSSLRQLKKCLNDFRFGILSTTLKQVCFSSKSFFVASHLAILALINLEDSSLQYLNKTLYDAKLIITIDEDERDVPREYLLLFQNLGVYVDANGRRSRVSFSKKLV